MANIVLPQVEIIAQGDNNTNILIEQNGEIKRLKLPMLDMLVTFADNTTATYQLFGEVNS